MFVGCHRDSDCESSSGLFHERKTAPSDHQSSDQAATVM